MKNKKHLVSFVAALLAVLMVFGIIAMIVPTRVSAESSSSIKVRLDALEEEKAGIDAKIEELEGQIGENFSSMEEIVAQKNLIDQEVFLLNQQIINLNNQIAEYGLLIADMQDELDAAEARLAELQLQNKARIRAMEKNGNLSYWSVIFKANSFVDLLDRLQMIEEIAAADKARLDEMQVAAEAVAEAKTGLETEKVALEASKEELNAAQVTMEEKRAEADALLSELVAIGIEYELLLEEQHDEALALALKISETEQDYENAKYQEWLAAQPPVVSTPSTTPSTSAPSSGGWIVPCSYTAFTSPFGMRIHPITGVETMHNGVDLAGPSGTPIVASRDGTVTTAKTGYNSGNGNYVVINHGDGFSTSYLHMLENLQVSVGQKVKAGQVIGYMGSTGMSTGPHLHFTIYYNGSTVNPADYINF